MDFLQDLKFGLRMMRRSPGFTAVAVLVLMLGIGGTAAMFGIVNTLVWRPITAKEPERLVPVYSKDKKPTGGYRSFSYPNLTEVREKNSAFTDVAAFTVCMVGVNEGDLIRKTFSFLVSANYFDTFGVRLSKGRGFLPEEARVDRGALAPHLLDADAAPLGLALAERSAIAVRTQPGSTAFDVTPNGPASWATARASPMTPCLEAVYALPARSAFSPAVELVKTSRPKPRLHMPPTVSRASSNGPSRLMRMVSRQTAGSCSHTSRSWAEPMPWFTTSRSIGPSRRSVSATASAQPSAVPRSATTYSRPTAASSDALRDTTITRAPAAASSSAASRPIPRPPPVTNATRPFIRPPD